MHNTSISKYIIDGLPLKTGDIICTTDGDEKFLAGQFWRLIGKLIIGEVDHIAIYLGPGGRCIEAGPGGIVTFNVANNSWDARQMINQRGLFIDRFYGVVNPFDGRDLSEENESEIRNSVAQYCLAQIGKGYNLNFFNAESENKFYCSQLAYKAYIKHGIDLNTGQEIPNILGTGSIIFPQEIWNGCSHMKKTN